MINGYEYEKAAEIGLLTTIMREIPDKKYGGF
jgi:hypothetical protein